MTFNQIKYFITVAECLSFTEAAKCLFITQPALSRQISAIEEELNTRLFVRSKKALKLTPGGVLLYNKLPHLLEEYNGIVEEARSANNGFEGILRLGFLDIYDIQGIISPVVYEFQRKYPQIQVSMERGSLGLLPQKLYEDELDMILTYGFSLYDKPDLLVENVEEFRSCIMMPRNHPLAGKEGLKLSDLKDEVFATLRPQESEEGYNYIIALMHRYGIHPRLRLVDCNASVLLWVETGSCVAITSDRTIEQTNGSVIIRPIPDIGPHDTALSWMKNNYNPAISLFLELFHQINGPKKSSEKAKLRYIDRRGQSKEIEELTSVRNAK